MNPIEDRSAGWYRMLAATVDDIGARQSLASTLQQAAVDRNSIHTKLGTQDAAEVTRFFRMAEALLHGQSMQTEMMQMQHRMMATQLPLMQQQAESTHRTIERFKLGMQNALEEAESGYSITKWMYVVLFGLGIGLVITAVVCGIVGRSVAWTAVMGIAGGAGTVVALLFGQQKALESSRADLLQLQIAVFSWLDNIVRLNTAATTIAQNSGVTPALLQELWKQSHQATSDVLGLVQTYCEPRNAAIASRRGAKQSQEEK